MVEIARRIEASSYQSFSYFPSTTTLVKWQNLLCFYLSYVPNSGFVIGQGLSTYERLVVLSG